MSVGKVIPPRAILPLLALLCGVLFFTRLGSVAFFEEDEPRFAAAAREMVETGDYLTPRFNGKLRINKPILFYWLAVAGYAAVGVGELGARLPSAVLGTGTVLLLFLFARGCRGARFGATAALMLATCLQIAAVLARAATADMTLIFFLTAALLAFFRAYTAPDARAAARFTLLFWGALGLAALAKGPAAVVLAAGILGLFALLRGDPGASLRRTVTPLGLLVFAAVAVPWYAAELAILGKTFYRGFFLAEHFGRYQGNVDPHHGPLWYFVPVALVMFYPWICFLPAGLAGIWRERRAASPLRLFACCWVVVVLGVFSLSGTKLPHYIAPLYPAAALLAAHAWEERLAGADTRAWLASEWFLALWGGLLTVAFAALAWAGPWLLTDLTGGVLVPVGPGPALLAVLFGAGWAGGLALLAMRRPAASLGLLAGTTAAALLSLQLFLAPLVARHWQDPLRDLAVEAARRAGATGQLVLFGHSASGLVYYSRRTVARVRQDRPDQLVALARRAPLYVITPVRRAPCVPPALGLHALRREGGFVLLGPPPGEGRGAEGEGPGG